MGLRLQTIGDFTAFRRGSIGSTALHTPRRWDLAAFITGRLIFVSWTLLVPLLFYPWWIVLISFVGVSLALSLTMVIVFQLAHCVEEAASPSVEELRSHPRIWAVHQVESTVDFCPGNPVLTWFLGGLNLPDRASPLPTRPAYALPPDRAHRPPEGREVRRALHGSGLVLGRHQLPRATPAPHGSARAGGRARDGLRATSPNARSDTARQ